MIEKPDLEQTKAFTPTLRIRQPDGSVILRAGKPIVLDDMIKTAEAADILGMSQRWIAWQCELGNFRTAYKPGSTRQAQWRIAREEVLARREAG